ncbi:hypothetical protein PV326_011311 [Microctonus aethiopoides]|nr:hypothetical protein PV326_011311 [Microctonus aethiopoides]
MSFYFLKPHEFMTPDERLEIFQTHDKLPIYEVIQIHLSKLHKRSTSDNQILVSMQAFNENITLLCEENDGILAGKNTPIYLIQNKTNKVIFKKSSVKVGDMKLYENISAGATLTICRHQNRQSITGVIKSKGLTIRSLPDRVANQIIKHRRSLENTSEIIKENDYYIAIKNIPSQSLNITYDFNLKLKRDTAEIPNIIFPEVLVIVNHDLERILNKNIVGNLVPYILSFWHAVDLMFRNLVEPKIRLNIAGIVIAKSPNVIEYLYENEIQLSNGKYGLNTYAALKNKQYWLYDHNKDISLNNYDVAFTMTSELCKINGCHDFMNGLSGQSGACHVDAKRKITSKAAIIQNKGAFDRIVTAAHELGHLLGADHDDVYPDCKDTTFMMNRYGSDRDSLYWSTCTLKAFDNFLRSGMADCLFNKPNPGEIIQIVLPGALMDLKEQCEKLGYGKPCGTINSKGICSELRCRAFNEPKGKCIRLYMPAATGTPCARGKICFQFKCVDKRELIKFNSTIH